MNVAGHRGTERRQALAAGFMLALVLMAHAMLETARDALFLASLPATRLPFVYLGVALVSGALMPLLDRWGERSARRLPGLVPIAFAAVGTLLLWAWLAYLGESGLYALYIWTGTAITVVLVRLWLSISSVFTVSQARRLYPSIRTGSVVGAIVGSGAASLFSHFTDRPAGLLPLSAAILVLSLVPARFLGGDAPIEEKEPESPTTTLRRDLSVLRNPYARHLLILGLLGAVTVTLGDYVFKATLADTVAPGSLGSIFGVIYFVTNLVGLVVQIGIVKWLVERIGPAGAIAALPIAVLLGGVGIIGLAGITGALLYKALEGPLRHTVDRTANEMLFVPLLESTRERVKRLADTLVKRGGQAAGSGLILLLLVFGLDGRQIGIALLAFAGLWVLAAFTLRQPYLSLFRRSLRIGSGALAKPAPMELDALETVLRKLNSADDEDVLAALDLLEEDRRLGVVPTLLLYHPSDDVVVRAAALLADDRRPDLPAVANRVFARASSRVKGALLIAMARVEVPGIARLRRLRDGRSPAAAAVAGVLLVHSEAVPTDAIPSLITSTLEADGEARAAFASAVAWFPHPLLDPVLNTLARDEDNTVVDAALDGIGRRRDPRFLPGLMAGLADMHTATEARIAIRALPPAAADALIEALVDEENPPEARWELPQLIVQVVPEQAAQHLFDVLPRTAGTLLHLSVLRGVALAASQDPTLTFSREQVESYEATAYDRALASLALKRAAERLSVPDACEPLRGLLVGLVSGLHRRSCEELLLLQSARVPGEDLSAVWVGLQASQESTRDASQELLRSLPGTKARELLVAIVDDNRPQLDALLAAEGLEPPEDLLGLLERSDDDAVRALTISLRRAVEAAEVRRGA